MSLSLARSRVSCLARAAKAYIVHRYCSLINYVLLLWISMYRDYSHYHMKPISGFFLMRTAWSLERTLAAHTHKHKTIFSINCVSRIVCFVTVTVTTSHTPTKKYVLNHSSCISHNGIVLALCAISDFDKFKRIECAIGIRLIQFKFIGEEKTKTKNPSVRRDGSNFTVRAILMVVGADTRSEQANFPRN